MSNKYLTKKPTSAILTDGSGRFFSSPVSIIISEDDVSISAILENNSWRTIKNVCKSGQAANYWAVGDCKKVTGSKHTRDVKIVHMGEIYDNKNVVFQFWCLTERWYFFDEQDSSVVETADIWDELAPNGRAYIDLVSDELGALLEDTTFRTAASGIDETLVELTKKLFIPAVKEVSTVNSFSFQSEFDALTTFDYYEINAGEGSRIIGRPQDGQDGQFHYFIDWWLRSPEKQNTIIDYGDMPYVARDGSICGSSADNSKFISACFAW